MKSRIVLTGLLAVLGVLVAAGVTVAAGEIVSRPIGLNGSVDDLGRSLTPSSGAVTTVTVKRTVTDERVGTGVDEGGESNQRSAPGGSGAPVPSGGGESHGDDDQGKGQDEDGHDDEGHDDDD